MQQIAKIREPVPGQGVALLICVLSSRTDPLNVLLGEIRGSPGTRAGSQRPSRALRKEVSYHMNTTILNTPLAQLRPLVSARTLHLLTRNGFTEIPDVQLALGLGTLSDLRGLGPVALMEIRLALDNLPETAPEPAPASSLSPLAENASALSGRELILILALAEAGHANRIYADELSRNEALATLGHLRQLAGEDEIGDLIPSEPAAPKVPADWPTPKLNEPSPAIPQQIIRREPEPVDDEFEGYVIEPQENWGRF